MSLAPPYSPTASFANDETNQVAGRSTVRTVAVDTELANISTTVNALKSNLEKLQRDDDKLLDFLVEPYALAEQTRALIAAGGRPRGLWAAGQVYAVGDVVQQSGFAYQCYTAHTATAPFTANGFWISISGDGSAATNAAAAAASEAAATAAAAAAAASVVSAGASATAAAASVTTAGTSATAAGNSATVAAASAAAAAVSVGQAATSEANAGSSATAAAASAVAAAASAAAISLPLSRANGGTGASYADNAALFAGIKQAASATATGVVELATSAEVAAGTDAVRAITPASLRAGPIQSMVRLHTANGNGSTNTAIRRFSTVVTNVGSDITYADSATLGATFTIVNSGNYEISYTDNFGNANELGLSLNSMQLTTSITGITAADRLKNATTGGASFSQGADWAGYLPAGAVIRAHTAVSPAVGTNALANFTIARVS